MGVDKYGLAITSEFWSGSDAALKLRALPESDLALRELVALASRRSIGLNAPKGWLSVRETAPFSKAWEPEATDVHFSQVELEDEEQKNVWSHYGMKKSIAEPVIYSYGMRQSRRSDLGRSGRAWDGGIGTWYPWSTLLEWDRWPRRQDVQASAVDADPGRLLLFVSHRWESLEHPDPNGSQLLCLKVGLLLSLAAAVLRLASEEQDEKTGSGLPDLLAEFLQSECESGDVLALGAWAQRIKDLAEHEEDETSFHAKAVELADEETATRLDSIRNLILVWYDFASMLQAPRTEAEEADFRSEILTLNEIQGHAGTVVIAGDEQYLSRAWCFLELCGGMRHRITELTPSWGSRIGVGDSVTQWASRSDQLIAALHALGLGSIQGSGLEATHPEDLADIARLLAQLPVTGLLETDDSDLIGGSLPIPYRSGEWVSSKYLGELEISHEQALTPVEDFGRILDSLREIGEQYAQADRLTETVGIWVYTTNRALTLVWAERARRFWEIIRSDLAVSMAGTSLEKALQSDGSPDVACMWADSRSLSDDGTGFTRVIPSSVSTLVIITQADLPDMCRIYERVVKNHIACGVPIITYSPETGRTLVYAPDATSTDDAESRAVNVLAVPRLRRSDAYPNRMFIAKEAPPEDIEVLAALRLDPAHGTIAAGEVHEPDPQEGKLVPVGEKIDASWLLKHSLTRVRVEGLARSIAATWDRWFSPLVNQQRWVVGISPMQLRIIEELVRKTFVYWDNPFLRRRFLKVLLEEHEGYLLPPEIVRDADVLAEMIRNAEENKST
jgi:hypothetical protein